MKIYLVLYCCLIMSFISKAQNVGVGTLTPSEKLDVNGNIKADSVKTNVLKIVPNAGAGKILMGDALGNARWQPSGNLIKAYNGLTKINDTINFGGRLYNTNTEIKLAQNELSFKDIGTAGVLLAGSTPAASNVVLSATPITQTFIPSSSAELYEVQLNITALNGGSITVQLKNSTGEVLASFSKNYIILTNGFDPFTFNVYLENTKTYTLSVTGNASAFLNYDLSSNSYPAGSSSLGPNADLAFNVFGSGEENLLSLKGNKVGIGTNNPTEKLEVNGNVKVANLIAGNSIQLTTGYGPGKVLTSDGAGIGTWASGKTIPGTISLTGNLNGIIAANLPVIVNSWEFFGPSTTVTLNGSQRVVMNMVAGLGKTAAGTGTFQLDVGYQLQPGGSVLNAASGNYILYQPVFPATLSKISWMMAGSFKPIAGTYKIGCVIAGGVAGYLNYNDYVNGTYMILNE